jgi:hypothetical protein
MECFFPRHLWRAARWRKTELQSNRCKIDFFFGKLLVNRLFAARLVRKILRSKHENRQVAFQHF